MQIYDEMVVPLFTILLLQKIGSGDVNDCGWPERDRKTVGSSPENCEYNDWRVLCPGVFLCLEFYAQREFIDISTSY